MRNNQEEAQIKNSRVYVDYYNRLKLMALNLFEWVNVPNSIDVRFLETKLYKNGYCIFFEDKDLGYLTLGGAISGAFNVYEIPLQRNAIATNGYQAQRNAQNSVIIFNNYIHTPNILTIELYAERLTEVQRSIDVNVRSQKHPILLNADEKTKLTLRNAWMQYDGNEPIIMGNKGYKLSELMEVIDFDTTTYNIDKLTLLKHDIWNECLTFLGLNNANSDKKERLITNEVDANLEAVEMSRQAMLSSRQQACDEINVMFKLDPPMSVKFKLKDTQPINNNQDLKETEDQQNE